MRIRKELLVFLTICFPFLFACALSEKNQDGCTLPPDNFSESTLVGTWVARDRGVTDTLIIKKENLYKQVIHSDNPVIDYESGWQKWKLESNDNAIPYLFLDGLRMCAYLMEQNCDRAGSDGGFWWDFCEKKGVDMPLGGGVLIVDGIPGSKQQVTGVWLTLPVRFTDAGAWTYEWQEP